jgi:hypothetical protein
MNRGLFINHLINQDCYPDEECDSEISQLWINAINGEFCYVPYEDELAVITWCQVVYELGIRPPHEYDAFFHVYQGWRNVQQKEDQE